MCSEQARVCHVSILEKESPFILWEHLAKAVQQATPKLSCLKQEALTMARESMGQVCAYADLGQAPLISPELVPVPATI